MEKKTFWKNVMSNSEVISQMNAILTYCVFASKPIFSSLRWYLGVVAFFTLNISFSDGQIHITLISFEPMKLRSSFYVFIMLTILWLIVYLFVANRKQPMTWVAPSLFLQRNSQKQISYFHFFERNQQLVKSNFPQIPSIASN